MAQLLIIGLIFAAAVGYLGRMIFRSFQAKHVCATGCAKCGAVDFEKIEKQINEAAKSQIRVEQSSSQ